MVGSSRRTGAGWTQVWLTRLNDCGPPLEAFAVSADPRWALCVNSSMVTTQAACGAVAAGLSEAEMGIRRGRLSCLVEVDRGIDRALADLGEPTKAFTTDPRFQPVSIDVEIRGVLRSLQRELSDLVNSCRWPWADHESATSGSPTKDERVGAVAGEDRHSAPNVAGSSSTFRHAVRLCLLVMVATAGYRYLPGARGNLGFRSPP